MEIVILCFLGFIGAIVFTMWSSMDRIDTYVGQSNSELKKRIWELQSQVDHLREMIDNMQTVDDEEDTDEQST